MVKVPLDAPLLVKVRVEVPLPVTVVGLKVAVTPAGRVPVDSETVPVKPFSAVMVIVVEPDPVRCIVRLEGDALMLKSGVAGPVTVRV
jgi:hypothetical protein